MNRQKLLVRSLLYFWRPNLAIVAGIVVGTAVIAGALIVGDSVRDSLRQMTLKRLGRIDHAVTGFRFFREQLADELSEQPGFADQFDSAAPLLLLTGSLEYERSDNDVTRASNLNVYGVDQRAWELTEHGELAVPEGDQIVLSERVANELDVEVGSDLLLWVELPAEIPRDSLLGEREEISREIPFTVVAIIDEELGVGRIGLNPSQQLPANVFVSLDTLQDRLELSELAASRRNPTGRIARVNSLFVASRNGSPQTDAESQLQQLNEHLTRSLRLTDLNLKLIAEEESQYLSLQSDQLILPDGVVEQAEELSMEMGLEQSASLIYLANRIWNPQRTPEKKAEVPGYAMYSMVAGTEQASWGESLGGFEVVSGDVTRELGHDEIVINELLAHDLGVQVGDTIHLTYHVVGSHGELPEKEVALIVRAVVAMSGLAADKALVPSVPGITDIDDIGDWDQPFPMKIDLVTDRDHDYWDQYRAIPKAFLKRSVAEELWSSRYGRVTTFRMADSTGQREPAELTDQFGARLIEKLAERPDGISFRAVKSEGLAAAVGANDFTGLFLAFSFFLIAAAGILIGLLFRLNIEQRATNIGLQAAIGFSTQSIRGLLLAESLMLALLGGVLGLLAAIGYASIMVYGLTTWWVGATGTTEIELSIRPLSLVGGLMAGLIVTIAVVSSSVWLVTRNSPRQLLLGGGSALENQSADTSRRLNRLLLPLSVGCGVLLVVGMLNLVPDREAFSGFSWKVVSFFASGFGLLVTSVLLIAARISGRSSSPRQSQSLVRLALQNAVRNRQRTVWTCGLMAFACFVIVAVAAGHRNPEVETPQVDSGNGGFLLVAESSQPVVLDLNDEADRANLGLEGDTPLQKALLNTIAVESFRVRPGEDSSCLNLYQTAMPTLLGASESMIRRGGFRFANTPSETPWKLLNQPLDHEDELPVIPVMGDMNTLQYSLKLGVGDSIDGPDPDQPKFRLRIVGMFDSSIFQGVLVMSAGNFDRYLPQQPAGFRYFLVSVPQSVFAGDPASGDEELLREAELDQPGTVARELSRLMESGLSSYGWDAELVSARLADFLAVQNTYLSTFQTLAGLGLLLGTFGLATVMLRNVLERRGELALLRAVGFRRSQISLLVLMENGVLLVWGVIAGSGSALIAMLPHLRSTGADVPWSSVGVLLIAVLVTGTLSALLAIREAVGTPIVAALRSE